MASICKELSIETSLGDAWSALRDWGALHERLAPGFATDTRLDGTDRIVTFFNGLVLRERLVDLDDRNHRLAWSVVGGPYEHHNGSAQVFADGERRVRFVWTSDLLPDGLAAGTAQLMEQSLTIIKQALEGNALPHSCSAVARSIATRSGNPAVGPGPGRTWESSGSRTGT